MPRPHTPVNAPTVTAEGDWLAPRAEHPVDATVTLPGSKSLTNRYLVLAALANGTSRLRRPLRSRDTLLMAQALRSLGAGVEDLPGDDPEAADWLVTPAALRGDSTVDCGLAGTVMRFLPRSRRSQRGGWPSTATPTPANRPMAPVVDALRALGAQVEDDGRGRLPFTVVGSGSLAGGAVTLDASASSQFISALLLAGARFDQGVVVHHDGKPVPSEPHIAMTVEVLRDARGDGRRQRGEHLAGRAVRGQRARRPRWSRTCPTPPRSSPRRSSPAAACACRAGRSRPPRRATRSATSSTRWARR